MICQIIICASDCSGKLLCCLFAQDLQRKARPGAQKQKHHFLVLHFIQNGCSMLFLWPIDASTLFKPPHTLVVIRPPEWRSRAGQMSITTRRECELQFFRRHGAAKCEKRIDLAFVVGFLFLLWRQQKRKDKTKIIDRHMTESRGNISNPCLNPPYKYGFFVCAVIFRWQLRYSS